MRDECFVKTDRIKAAVGEDMKLRLSFPASKPDSLNLAENSDDLRCSFCYKSQADVRKLIASPSDRPFRAYICDECIQACHSIFEDVE